MRSACRWALIVFGLLPLTGCNLAYMLKQGAGQASLFMQREDMDRATRDARLSVAQRASLEVIREAKRFAVQQLGLHESASYEQVVVLDRSAVTYVVAAAPPDSLAPYLWSFPVVGAVPYKGFFDKQDALREKAHLEAEGYDTYLRGVAAFSLLGWLPDPIYSSLLDYPPGILANIIIHELTHGTVFLQGAARFNEGFATFVGNQGALRFFRERDGAGAASVRAVEADLRDEARFGDFIQALAGELRALYAQPWTPAEKLARRQAIFERARDRIPTLGFESPGYARLQQATLNNAYVMTQLTYRENLGRFARILDRFGGDLPAMIRFFRDTVAKQPDPEAFADRYLAAP